MIKSLADLPASEFLCGTHFEQLRAILEECCGGCVLCEVLRPLLDAKPIKLAPTVRHEPQQQSRRYAPKSKQNEPVRPSPLRKIMAAKRQLPIPAWDGREWDNDDSLPQPTQLQEVKASDWNTELAKD